MTTKPNEQVKTFGRRVERARSRRHLSMRALAKLAGISSQTVIYRIEHGDGCTLRIAISISQALGLSLDSLTRPGQCAHCDDDPPDGYICPRCGRGPEASDDPVS